MKFALHLIYKLPVKALMCLRKEKMKCLPLEQQN